MLLRTRRTILKRDSPFIQLEKNHLINFASNDYLSLSSHPELIKACVDACQHYGISSSASASVSGFYETHLDLEESFARFLKRDRAILFSSGYLANVGVISSLASRQHHILSDKLCHASILDGIQLSRALHWRYPHNHLLSLNNLLKKTTEKTLIVTESIFSMEGDLSPIDKIAKLSQEKAALLLVDDAHGFGVLGENGGGVSDYFKLEQQDLPCLIIPFGKALACMGAIVAGPHILIEHILQLTRTYRYSTALPPAMAKAGLSALAIIQKEKWRRLRLQQLIRFFIREARERSLPLISYDETPIKSILIKNNQKVLQIERSLQKAGFLVPAIRPPTVPLNTARLRISLQALHEESQIISLLDHIRILNAA